MYYLSTNNAMTAVSECVSKCEINRPGRAPTQASLMDLAQVSDALYVPEMPSRGVFDV